MFGPLFIKRIIAKIEHLFIVGRSFQTVRNVQKTSCNAIQANEFAAICPEGAHVSACADNVGLVSTKVDTWAPSGQMAANSFAYCQP